MQFKRQETVHVLANNYNWSESITMCTSVAGYDVKFLKELISAQTDNKLWVHEK